MRAGVLVGEIASAVLAINTAVLSGLSVQDATAQGSVEVADTASSYARDFSVSSDVAKERMASQPAMENFVSEMERRFPRRFAGGWIENGPEWGVVVRFTEGEPVAEAQSTAKAAAFRVRIVHSGSLTRAEGSADAMRVADEISADSSSAIDGVYFDEEQGIVVILANEPLTQSISAKLSSSADVDVVLVPDGLADANRGGLPLSGPTMICTSGFSVINRVGSKGILTAGHCENTQSYATTPTNLRDDTDKHGLL